jgi:hypothetical protein
MSCYSDLGPDLIVLGPEPNQVTVNPGAREVKLDAFLTQHNLMFDTVTVGGFFPELLKDSFIRHFPVAKLPEKPGSFVQVFWSTNGHKAPRTREFDFTR